MTMHSVDEQLAALQRGIEQIEPVAEFRKKLERSIQTGKPLRIKYGIDPTGIDVHLGHTVPLRKLRQFQELGHQAILIIGNYTALVGDPSGRDQARQRLTEEQVEANARDYLKQISKIIDIDRTEVHTNGTWFSKFSFLDVLSLTSKITIQRMLERDDFTKRREAGTPIYLHECLYPLMQGQDSVEINADVELGGSEQLFTLLLARHLQQDAGQEGQVCMTLPILRGLDGQRRMGKSLGNYVGVGMQAQEQFDKTMSIPDELLQEWFELLTDRSRAEVETLVQESPFEAKKRLAADIVGFYYGPDVAANCRTEWEKTKSDKQDPSTIPEVSLSASELNQGSIDIIQLLVLTGLADSKSAARRMIVPNSGVTIGPDRTKVTDPQLQLQDLEGLIVRFGNRKIVRVRLND